MPTYIERYAPELLPKGNEKMKVILKISPSSKFYDGIVELKTELKRMTSRRLPRWYRHLIFQCVTASTCQ